MNNLIAELTTRMTRTDTGTQMEGRISFDGDRDDMVAFIAHLLFGVLELEPAESFGLILDALKLKFANDEEAGND